MSAVAHEKRAGARKTTADPAVVVRLFYLISVGALFLGLALVLDLATGQSAWHHPVFLAGLIGLAVLFGLRLAAFHASDARRNAAAFLVKRLSIKALDLRQDHHRRIEVLFGKQRPVSGRYMVKPFVIPGPAVEALAFVMLDGTACVAMTEGLLLEFSPEELEAVAAFEIAWLEGGEAGRRGFVCGLGDFYERVGATMSPERLGKSGIEERLSSFLRSFLSRSFDPEAVFAADAAAARTLADPLALARALAKAEAKASSGDHLPRAYAPLLFAGPDSKGGDLRTSAGWKGRRPTAGARARRLARMAGADPNRILPRS